MNVCPQITKYARKLAEFMIGRNFKIKKDILTYSNNSSLIVTSFVYYYKRRNLFLTKKLKKSLRDNIDSPRCHYYA